MLLWSVGHLVKFAKDIKVSQEERRLVADSDRTISLASDSTGLSFSAMAPLRMNTFALWKTVYKLVIRSKKIAKRRKPRYDDPTPSPPIRLEPSSVPESSSSSTPAPVVDLTDQIRITYPHAVAHGGFADIHRGEWDQAAGETEGVAGKTTQVCTSFPSPLLRP